MRIPELQQVHVDPGFENVSLNLPQAAFCSGRDFSRIAFLEVKLGLIFIRIRSKGTSKL